MRHPFSPPIIRMRVRPDDPRAVTAPRPRGSSRPHTDARVAEVRRLIEQSTLTYTQIAERTGVGRASICRWTRDGNWQRPPFAPRATDTVPRARASAKLKRRTLAARLTTLAERYLRELEGTAGVQLDKLAAALELMTMAKLADRPRRRRRKTGEPRSRTSPAYDDPAQVIALLRNAGVNLDRAPQAAVTDFIDSHAPARDFPELRERGKSSRRKKAHARMLERE